MKNNRMNPRIGVALLAYNQGKYIDDAIESLRKQTFQDFEVFLIDDGSDDGFTPQKLESIEYDKITCKFLNKENLGSPERRIQYDRMMKNKYIINFCGDDILAPDFFKKTVSFLDRHSDYGAVCTNLKYFHDSIGDSYYEKKYEKNTMKFPEMLVSCNMLGSSLIRREALEGLNLAWPLKRYYDWNRWNAMLASGWKLGLVPEALFYYRQLKESLSHTGNMKDEIDFRKELMKRYSEVYDKEYKKIILELYLKLAEVDEGKNWLEKQYDSLKNEINRLEGEIKELNKKNKECEDEKSRLNNKEYGRGGVLSNINKIIRKYKRGKC